MKELPNDIKEAQALGVSIYAGEAEEGLDEAILDAARGELRPLYDHMKHLPDIGDIAAPPFLPVDFVRRTIGNVTSFDAGRGCPFQCSFCTIINVQGRKSRYRSPEFVEQIIRMNYDQGVNRFFITDDNFARNKDWEAIYDRIIKLREEDGLDIFASAFRWTRSATAFRTSSISRAAPASRACSSGSRTSIPPI